MTGQDNATMTTNVLISIRCSPRTAAGGDETFVVGDLGSIVEDGLLFGGIQADDPLARDHGHAAVLFRGQLRRVAIEGRGLEQKAAPTTVPLLERGRWT